MTKKRYPRLLGLLPLFGTLLLGGCNMTLLDPVGQVGIEERNLIITATLLMLLVVVPVILMTLIFAWKYRASNKNAPIVDGLPLATVFPLGFQVEGFCSTPYPPVFGLSLAQWALVAFVLTSVLVPLGIYRNRKKHS